MKKQINYLIKKNENEYRVIDFERFKSNYERVFNENLQPGKSNFEAAVGEIKSKFEDKEVSYIECEKHRFKMLKSQILDFDSISITINFLVIIITVAFFVKTTDYYITSSDYLQTQNYIGQLSDKKDGITKEIKLLEWKLDHYNKEEVSADIINEVKYEKMLLEDESKTINDKIDSAKIVNEDKKNEYESVLGWIFGTNGYYIYALCSKEK